jgi:cytosine/adenosine deaminase-related metal-dependent hydrolase
MAAESPGPFPALGKTPLFIGPLPYQSTPALNRTDQGLSFAAFFSGAFGSRGLETSLNPGAEEISRIRAQTRGASALVLACVNAHLNRGQIDLAGALARAAIPLVLVSLGNPCDLREAAAAYKLAAWEYTENSLNALEAVFRGDYQPAAPAADLGLI